MVVTTNGLFRVPVVQENLCIGCGQCEKECPINDTAAIVVFNFGENRIAEGPYAGAAQKQAILDKRNRKYSFDNDTAGLSGEGMSPPVSNPASINGEE